MRPILRDCPDCHRPLSVDAATCPHCGHTALPTLRGTAAPPRYYSTMPGPAVTSDAATILRSGTIDAPVRGFNWGAAMFSWIWGLNHRAYWTFATLGLAIVGFVFRCFALAMAPVDDPATSYAWMVTTSWICGLIIPLVNLLILPIWYGIKGNRWAWESGRFRTVDEFRTVQRIWAIVALIGFGFECLLILLLAASLLPVFFYARDAAVRSSQQHQARFLRSGQPYGNAYAGAYDGNTGRAIAPSRGYGPPPPAGRWIGPLRGQPVIVVNMEPGAYVRGGIPQENARTIRERIESASGPYASQQIARDASMGTQQPGAVTQQAQSQPPVPQESMPQGSTPQVPMSQVPMSQVPMPQRGAPQYPAAQNAPAAMPPGPASASNGIPFPSQSGGYSDQSGIPAAPSTPGGSSSVQAR